MQFRRWLFAVAVVLVSAAAYAADPPVITSIEPASAPVTGGTHITITGRNLGLAPNFACIAECPPRVKFGAIEIAAHEYNDARVVVQAPPQAAGVVDVTLTTGDERTVTLPRAFTYTDSPEDAWEKILVPLYFEEPIRGGGGSLWKTEFALRNNGSTSLEVAPYLCEGVCLPVYPTRIAIEPGVTLTKLPKADPKGDGARGRLIFATKHLADQLSLQLRVSDASRAGSDGGTEIPVVRSRNFFSGPMQMLNVPFATTYRYHVRIYETANVPASFRLRVYVDTPGKKESVALLDHIVTASSPVTDPEFRSEPYHAEVNLGPIPPVLGAQIGSGVLRFEVTPLAKYSRAWSMLTVTSNNGHVTVVTPQ